MEFVLEPFSAATKISYQLNSIKYFFCIKVVSFVFQMVFLTWKAKRGEAKVTLFETKT